MYSRTKREYDTRHQVGESNIKAGDRIYLRRLQPRKHKLEPSFIGPYRVIERKGDKIETYRGKEYEQNDSEEGNKEENQGVHRERIGG